ncbi:hypothetical protein ACHJH3_06620 [Campylobacter sp. MOP7]|uniref:hypothetical protein n=1 Tax=Campylobacter canis TaxID=3378588 RepID=UPI00387EA6D6
MAFFDISCRSLMIATFLLFVFYLIVSNFEFVEKNKKLSKTIDKTFLGLFIPCFLFSSAVFGISFNQKYIEKTNSFSWLLVEQLPKGKSVELYPLFTETDKDINLRLWHLGCLASSDFCAQFITWKKEDVKEQLLLADKKSKENFERGRRDEQEFKDRLEYIRSKIKKLS